MNSIKDIAKGSPATPVNNTLIRSVLAIALLIVALAYLFTNEDFLTAFKTYSPRQIAAALLIPQPFIFLVVFLTAFRHRLLVTSHHSAPRFMTCLKAILLAIGLNIILPARTSELLKVTYIAENAKAPTSYCLAAVFLERFVDLFILAFCALLALSYQYGALNNYTVLVAIGVPVLFFISVPLLPKITHQFEKRFPAARIAKFSNAFSKRLLQLVKPKLLLKNLVIGGLIWSTAFIGSMSVLYAFSPPGLGLSFYVIVFVMSTFGSALPLLPGGVGTYQAAAMIPLTQAGFSLEEALFISILMQLSMYLILLPSALLVMTRNKIGLKRLIQPKT